MNMNMNMNMNINIISHPFVQTNPLFAKELQLMREKTMKVELESVYCHGIDYFSKTYMKEKVLEALSTFSLLLVCSFTSSISF